MSSFLRHIPGGETVDRAKDRLISQGAKDRLNQVLAPYGQVDDLRIDTQNRHVRLSLSLNGESQQIEIEVARFEIVQSPERTFVRVNGSDITTSREWLTQLIRDKGGERELSIPDRFSWLVRLLV